VAEENRSLRREGLDIVISAPCRSTGSRSERCHHGDFPQARHRISEEVLNELKMGLNYQVYNLYYNFEGS
jgi:hypothetical protein